MKATAPSRPSDSEARIRNIRGSGTRRPEYLLLYMEETEGGIPAGQRCVTPHFNRLEVGMHGTLRTGQSPQVVP